MSVCSVRRYVSAFKRGPPGGTETTPIDEVSKLATWGVQPATNVLGMILYTFSQDIQQFT